MNRNKYGDSLAEIVSAYSPEKIKKIRFLGGGFYGRVFKVTLADKSSFIVKLHLYDGLCDKEALQLAELRKNALLPMPKVYKVIHKKDGFPFDALIMDEIKGHCLSSSHIIRAKTRNKIADSVVDNLIHYHSVKGDSFGEIGGEQFPSWKAYYKTEVDNALESFGKYCETHSENERLLSDLKSISGDFEQLIDENIEPSLIHGDYNTMNIMTKNGVITGIIDPYGASYGDREFDLFQLNNFNGRKLKLFENYKSKSELSENVDKKILFYEIFSHVKHYTAVDSDRLDKLEKAVKEYKKL